MKKNILGSIVISLIICILTLTGCENNNESKMEKTLKKLRLADSFLVVENNTTIFQCDGKSVYWKYAVDDEIYNEYYFFPDNEGKYWVFERGYNADKWIKEALPVSTYYDYIYMIKSGLGIDDYNVFNLIDCICLDFSSCTIEIDGKYSLVGEFYYHNDFVFWKNKEDLIFTFSEKSKYTVSSINKTKIKFPSALADAVVGDVSLP